MRGQPKLIKLTDKSGNLKSPNWYIYVNTGEGDCRVSTGHRIGEEDAEAQLFFHRYCLDLEKPIAKDPGQLMLAQALKDYYEEHAQYTATAKHFKYHEKRLNTGFPAMLVSQLTPSGVKKYVRDCQNQGESNGTVRRDLEVLQAALNHEVAEQRITHAPKIKKPEPPAPRDRYLTTEEVERLMAECTEDHLRSFCVLMFNTGQRPGAIENLKWFQVNFAEREIHFEHSSKYKNKKARTVVMNNEVYNLLLKLFDRKQTEYVLERYFAKKQKSVPAGCVKKSFAAAVKRAGLANVGRYTLRHTVLDRLNDVADEKTASDIGGHSNTRTTRQNYIKSKKEKQRTALDNLWAKPGIAEGFSAKVPQNL